MTVKELLTPIILQEFQKYQNHGHKIKLKSTSKRRWKYSLICGGIALFSLTHGPVAILCWVITGIVYACLMKKTSNIDTIIALAKNSPDTPIEQIVAQEIKI